RPLLPTRPDPRPPPGPGRSRSEPMPDPNDTMQILDKLRKLRIATPRDKAFKAHLDRLLCRDEAGNLTHEPQRFSAGRETRGVMVIDGPGGGKTTLIARAL